MHVWPTLRDSSSLPVRGQSVWMTTSTGVSHIYARAER